MNEWPTTEHAVQGRVPRGPSDHRRFLVSLEIATKAAKTKNFSLYCSICADSSSWLPKLHWNYNSILVVRNLTKHDEPHKYFCLTDSFFIGFCIIFLFFIGFSSVFSLIMLACRDAFFELSLDERKAFLQFLTGTYRLPVRLFFIHLIR